MVVQRTIEGFEEISTAPGARTIQRFRGCKFRTLFHQKTLDISQFWSDKLAMLDLD